ncbi:MAG: chemotaxis protein CheW [Cellulomonas sp.]|uniref:chemotaxis protein CheW n=1 Tax=Cellulomonas sp. TaxID=40001 RepID=UPI001A08F2AE|nr:chemotaxis protein CheW [Cellulomonas sp.]MBF0689167.1 chemotaxis protein CheW [Cellulomonas sp.]
MDDVDEIVREFLMESLENLDQLDQDLVALEKDPTSRPLLSSVFRTIHTIKGTSGFLAFARLERLTHAGESLLAELRDGRRTMDQRTTDVLLAMVDRVRSVLAAVDRDGTEGDVPIDDVVAALEGVLAAAPATETQDVPATATVPVEPAVVPPAPAVPTPHPSPEAGAEAGVEAAEEPGAQVRAAETAIRVDVDLLDGLMRQVGELVLARNRITRLAADLEDLDLSRTAQQLDLVAGELQEGVMRTRMQPIEHLWSKMPRVVRDLASTCGREVQLEMSGGETEVDRSVLEAVKDPLTHLVRNAVDHGIEPPASRVAAGKPATGRLSMRAFHSGGQVVVEVADDGAGIDPAVVGAKAVERGLRTAEQVAAATPAELLHLVFLPGFSTAQAVTNVSGRGVGMDVVRTKIEGVGGTVDVESQVGEGTVWRLRIPLTLAIMPALTVECDGDVYALPQVDLLELVALGEGRGALAVEHVHGARVYRLRGELLPLVGLSEVLGTGSWDAAQDAVVAVVQAHEHRFGLVVDRVLHTEEIVVKALSARLTAIGLYAGAAVLGDGRVCLIVDVQAVARRAMVGDVEVTAPAADVTAEAAASRPVLVVTTGDGRRVALPTDEVTRLEHLRADQVERVGGREVVRRRGVILPLARLDDVLGADPGDPVEDMLVVVLSRGGRSAGIVVHQVLDIVDDVEDRHADVSDRGLVGSTVIGEHVVELLDVRTAVLAADPGFLDAVDAAEPAGAEA